MRPFTRILLLLAVATVGCESSQTVQRTESAADKAAEQPAEVDQDFLESAKSLYQQAKEAGTTQAGSAKQWLTETWQQSVDSGGDAAQQSAKWINEQFQRAKSTGETTATNAKDFVMQDIANMGSWEYQVLSVKESDGDGVKKLNQLGGQRWECFFVDRTSGQLVFYLKRPTRSYLKHIPARDLLRLMPLLGGDDSEGA